MAKEVDVVIVGAGISGLVAADELRKKAPNLDVVILEANGESIDQFDIDQTDQFYSIFFSSVFVNGERIAFRFSDSVNIFWYRDIRLLFR